MSCKLDIIVLFGKKPGLLLVELFQKEIGLIYYISTRWENGVCFVNSNFNVLYNILS